MIGIQLLVVYLSFLGRNLCGGQCLTWEIYYKTNIRFICRVPNFFLPVSLIDNRGNLFAKCTFYNFVKACLSTNGNVVSRENYTTNQVSFFVDREYFWEYDGIWTCLFGSDESTSSVSMSEGIINSTSISLKSYTKMNNTIELKCTSCRTSIGNNAEFLVNESSVDSLTYDTKSGECIRRRVPCVAHICSCAVSGNEFSVSLLLDPMSYQSTSLACDLIFIDPISRAKFSKTAVAEFNGTAFIQTFTRTTILKEGHTDFLKIPVPTSAYTTMNVKDDTHGKSSIAELAVFSVSLLLSFVSLIILFLYRKMVLKKSMQSKKQLPSPDISIIGSDTRFERESLKSGSSESSRSIGQHSC